jgi:hypothetical protein
MAMRTEKPDQSLKQLGNEKRHQMRDHSGWGRSPLSPAPSASTPSPTMRSGKTDGPPPASEGK